MQRYAINPKTSTVVIDARSTVGPIAWEVVGPAGEFEVAVSDGGVDTTHPASGYLEIAVGALTSGNRLYDGELQRRIEARTHPTARVELTGLRNRSGALQAEGRLTFHSVTRDIHGRLDVELRSDGSILVTGEHDIDIRDFGIPAPSMLMLKIHPDVRVHIVLEGRPVAARLEP